MSKELKPLVHYYIRNGWYNQALKLCESSLQKKGKDNVATFWRAVSIAMPGNATESLRQLEGMQSRRDVELPAALALIYFHKQQPTVDKEAIENIRGELSVTRDVSVS